MNIIFSAFLLAALASASPAPAVVVHMHDYAFHDATVTVHAGDAVQFVNDDSDAHTVTATDKSFDSGGLDAHQSWTHTFTQPGKYAYFCALHPYMKGVVVVIPVEQKAGS
jgi:plastocyanin